MRGVSLAVVFVAFVVFCCGAEVRRTPAGYFPSECVHEIPNGARVQHMPNLSGVTVHHSSFPKPLFIPSCSRTRGGRKNSKKTSSRQFPSDYDGWLAYTTFNVSGTFSSFIGNFSVPNAPQETPDVLYIFTGLQNVNWIPIVDPEPRAFDIIQPVLQYDEGGWGIRSWYVTLTGSVLYSQEVSCQAGDVVLGNMTWLKKTWLGGGEWYIGATVARTQQTSSIVVDKKILLQQPWAYTTVECYGCRSCAYLPTNDLYFTSMSATTQGSSQPVQFNWRPHVSPNPVCNTKAHIINSATVTYSFQ